MSIFGLVWPWNAVVVMGGVFLVELGLWWVAEGRHLRWRNR